MPLKEREDRLFQMISSDRFLNMRGLNSEVPFFICPFIPEETIGMESTRRSLVQRLEQRNITIKEINLYDLCIEILRKEDLWDQVLDVEPRWSKSKLMRTLQDALDPTTYLGPQIAELTAQSKHDVLFLCGIGEVYPYIRSHNVLSNLQGRITKKPVVLFFPGKYTDSQENGMSLGLFGRLHGHAYYRASNIFDFEPSE